MDIVHTLYQAIWLKKKLYLKKIFFSINFKS